MLDLLSKYSKTALFKKLDSEIEAEALVLRRKQAAELATAHKQMDDPAGVKLAKAAYAATERRVAADAALKASIDAEAAAHTLWTTSNMAAVFAIERLQRELAESASPRINAAILRTESRWENVRNGIASTEPSIGGFDNFKAQSDRMVQLMAVIRELRLLKLEALTPEQLTERLATIEASVA